MTAILEPPVNQSLTTKAMLVDLTIRQWAAGKNDKDASRTVSNQHESDPRMGHYYKHLLSTDALSAVRTTARTAYLTHIKRTLPWLDNGQRVLSSAGYFDYMESMRKYRADYQSAVDHFCTDYPKYIINAQSKLKGLFKFDEYPAVESIRDRFNFEVNIFPIPAAEDFRIPLQDVDQVKQQIDQFVKSATSTAVSELNTRIHTAVSHMADRLRGYSGTRDGAFRDSLVENMRELSQLIPSLNITSDPEIEAIGRRIESELCLFDSEDLRKDEATRNQTAQAAEEILDRMKAFI